MNELAAQPPDESAGKLPSLDEVAARASEVSSELVDGTATLESAQHLADAAVAGMITSTVHRGRSDASVVAGLKPATNVPGEHIYSGNVHPAILLPNDKDYIGASIEVKNNNAERIIPDDEGNEVVRIFKNSQPATVSKLTGNRAVEANKIIQNRAARQTLERAATQSQKDAQQVQALVDKNS